MRSAALLLLLAFPCFAQPYVPHSPLLKEQKPEEVIQRTKTDDINLALLRDIDYPLQFASPLDEARTPTGRLDWLPREDVPFPRVAAKAWDWRGVPVAAKVWDWGDLMPVRLVSGVVKDVLGAKPVVVVSDIFRQERERAARQSAVDLAGYARRALATRSIVPDATRARTPAPPFYSIADMIDLGWMPENVEKLLLDGRRHVLLFRGLYPDWRKRYAAVLPYVGINLPYLDCKVGNFDHQAVEDFVRETYAQEVAFGWEGYFGEYHPTLLTGLIEDLHGAMEAAKRGNPDVFVWLQVQGGAHPFKQEWIDQLKPLPFDGIAVYNIVAMPVDWRDGFLSWSLAAIRNRWGDRPVALGWIAAMKIWKMRDHYQLVAARERVAALQLEVEKEAERIGYSAIWWVTSEVEP